MTRQLSGISTEICEFSVSTSIIPSCWRTAYFAAVRAFPACKATYPVVVYHEMKSAVLAILSVASAIAFAAEVPKVLPIGSDLPSFSLPGTDGKVHTEKDYADAKILCIIFTCNHCPDSVAAAARTEEIHQDYKDKGVAVVAVNANNPGSRKN